MTRSPSPKSVPPPEAAGGRPAEDHPILDDLFLGCALTAFVRQAVRDGGWPDPEATRQRAFRLYEDALAEKNGGTSRARGPAPAPAQSEDA